jgi:hypothetical protein
MSAILRRKRREELKRRRAAEADLSSEAQPLKEEEITESSGNIDPGRADNDASSCRGLLNWLEHSVDPVDTKE